MKLSIEKVLWIKPSEGIAASGRIPEESEYFQDHFPGFPVLPGVLALEMLKQTAEHYLESVHQSKDSHYFLKKIHATKFSTYLKPGDVWESQLKLVSEEGNQSHWSAELLYKGKSAVKADMVIERRTSAAPLLAS